MTNLNECPGCGGPADNGHDRCLPPNVYYCTNCETNSMKQFIVPSQHIVKIEEDEYGDKTVTIDMPPILEKELDEQRKKIETQVRAVFSIYLTMFPTPRDEDSEQVQEVIKGVVRNLQQAAVDAVNIK